MLKLQYFGHLMRRVDSLEKTLTLGGIGGRRRRGNDRGWDGWMASPTWWAWVWVDSGSWWWTGRPGVLWFMESQRVGHDWATELNWSQLYTNAKGTSLGRKHKRRKRSVENKPSNLRNGQKNLLNIFSKEDILIQMINVYMKKYSVSLITRKCKSTSQ